MSARNFNHFAGEIKFAERQYLSHLTLLNHVPLGPFDYCSGFHQIMVDKTIIWNNDDPGHRHHISKNKHVTREFMGHVQLTNI